MKRSKYHKILATVCWIVLILNLILIASYISIICCIFVILLTSYKTYKRKFIALFLLVLYKVGYKSNYCIDGFCALINRSFNFNFSRYLKNKIKYIKPINSDYDNYWFKPNDWEIRIDYLKTILKE